jgi:hypothetical protein
MKLIKRIFSAGTSKYVAFAVVLVTVLAVAAPAFAVDNPGAVVVEGGADTLSETLIQVATYALPLAAGIVAIVVGWRMARKFLRA